jgi:hypothetical protein
LDGALINNVTVPEFNFIETKSYYKGIYLVKIITERGRMITDKIIIN